MSNKNVIQQLMRFRDAIREVEKADLKKEITEELSDCVYEDLNKIFETSVAKFYNSYKPIYYGRKKSLYKAYKIYKSGIKIGWMVGSDLMPDVHRVDNKYIYKMSFEMGWHGGADKGEGHPNPGMPWYRTPFGEYSRWSDYPATNIMPDEYPPAIQIQLALKEYQNGTNGTFNIIGHTLKERVEDSKRIVLDRYEYFNFKFKY